MYERHVIGKKGEDYSAKLLEDEGYTIIERNFECKTGEIDIIAFDNKKEELVFIEVKTRTNVKYGSPADAVDETKKKHIYKTARYYLYKNNMLDNTFVRIDVIEVFITNNNYKINHIKQIM